MDRGPAGRREGRQRPHAAHHRRRLLPPRQQQAGAAGDGAPELQGSRGPEVQGADRALRAHRAVAGLAVGRLCVARVRRRAPEEGHRQREGVDAGRDRRAEADRPRRVRDLHPSDAGRRRRYLEAAQAAPVSPRGAGGRRHAPDRRDQLAAGRAAPECRPGVHELPHDQARAADLRRRRGRALHPEGRQAVDPRAGALRDGEAVPE